MSFSVSFASKDITARPDTSNPNCTSQFVVEPFKSGRPSVYVSVCVCPLCALERCIFCLLFLSFLFIRSLHIVSFFPPLLSLCLSVSLSLSSSLSLSLPRHSQLQTRDHFTSTRRAIRETDGRYLSPHRLTKVKASILVFSVFTDKGGQTVGVKLTS